MTVQNTNRVSGPLAGDGATTFWPFDFFLADATHLRVRRYAADGTYQDISSADYTLSANSLNNENGGRVQYPNLASPDTPLQVGEELFIFRVTPVTQTMNLTQQRLYDPETVENFADKVVRILQEQGEELSRTLTVDFSQSDGEFDFDQWLLDIEAAAGYATQAQAYRDEVLAIKAQMEALLAGFTGGGTLNLTFADSPYLVTATEKNFLIEVDTSGGNVVINLPQISSVGEPFSVLVKKTTDDSNTITVNAYNAGDGTDDFDEGTGNFITLSALNEAYSMYADEGTTPDTWRSLQVTGLLNAGQTLVDEFIVGTDISEGGTTLPALTRAPGDKNQVVVYIDGQYIRKDDYSVAGDVITFDFGVPEGSEIIECHQSFKLAQGELGTAVVGEVNLTQALIDLIVFTDRTRKMTAGLTEDVYTETYANPWKPKTPADAIENSRIMAPSGNMAIDEPTDTTDDFCFDMKIEPSATCVLSAGTGNVLFASGSAMTLDSGKVYGMSVHYCNSKLLISCVEYNSTGA